MKTKISTLLDAIDDPKATKFQRCISGLFWAFVLVGFAYSCALFAFIFQ